MAIVMMVSKEKAEALEFKNIRVVDDFLGHETTRIAHNYKCKHSEEPTYETSFGVAPLPTCTSPECRNFSPLYMETTYIGCVVADREMNGYSDSDFVATVWDEAKGEFRDIVYGSTRGWTYPNGAKVDATPEIKEKYEAHLQALHDARVERRRKEEAAAIRIGKQVEVCKGRKVAIGTVAEVFWVGPCKYNRNKVNAGIRLLNGDRVFVDSANLKVV